ncbi:MAG: substrate-binding domain-containing protein [Micrococcales bacterium]
MRLSMNAIATAAALAASVALVAPAAIAAENITAGGSSFAFNILDTCSKSYTADTVKYASVGSGTGRANFLNGTYDFGASDVAYGATDKKPASFTYVPLIGGPIAIVFNIPGVTKINLSATILAAIMKGSITKWDDPSIAANNSTVKLPSENINVVYRSGSSGTTQNLARFLRGNGGAGYYDSGNWATATGQSVPAGTSAANAQVMVSTVTSTKYSIGYADLSDAASKGLPFVSLRNAAGEYLQPSVKAAAAFLSVQTVGADGILAIDYKKPVKGGYNASLVTYALAPTASASATKGAAIKKFLTYVINTCAPANGPALNYAPLSAALKATALKLVALVK